MVLLMYSADRAKVRRLYSKFSVLYTVLATSFQLLSVYFYLLIMLFEK